MCGIAGIYRRGERADDAPAVRRMLARLVRRGPDGEGLEQDGPLTLGHRRLAIIDLSDAGRQPMWSGDGRYLVSYNGEVYNFAELRERLGVKQEHLRSTSDTEILLLAWQRWGPGALDCMVGQWAFALYDSHERRLYLVRDRFGEKPLYYHEDGATLTFASSLAALLEAPGVPRELDPSALAEYLTLRYVVSPRTVLSGVKKVPAGHYVSVGPEGVSLRAWYEPRFDHEPNGAVRSDDDLAEEFGALLGQASRRCLVSDVPVALLLSEGIDSNGVRFALAESGRQVPSFTYTTAEAGESDGVVPMNGDGHHDVPMWNVRASPTARLEQFAEAFSDFTEPLGDGASLATWLLIRAARPHATVFLCGHGADEVLGGYRLSQDRFRLAAMRYISWLPPFTLRLLIDNKMFGDEPSGVRQRRLLFSPGRRIPAAARYLIHRPLPAEDLSEIFSPARVPERYLQVVDSLYAGCDDAAADVDRIQEVMIRTFLAENILSFADSVAMGSSAELRLPYLDRDLVDFVLKLPPRLRVSRWPGRANTKQILRFWARRHLPPEIAERRKWSFNYGSVRQLLAADGDAVRDRVLGASAVRRCLPGIERWLAHPPEYFRGPWEGTLWALLSLGVWAESAGVR